MKTGIHRTHSYSCSIPFSVACAYLYVSGWNSKTWKKKMR